MRVEYMKHRNSVVCIIIKNYKIKSKTCKSNHLLDDDDYDQAKIKDNITILS
jgi:hypothetical protein